MNLYRPRFTRNGKTHTSRVYWVSAYVNRKRRRESTGCTDKRAAEQKARTMLQRWEHEATGVVDRATTQNERPLSEHVDEFRSTLSAAGSSDDHVADRTLSLRQLIEATGAKRLSDLDAGAAASWLADMRRRGSAPRTVNRKLAGIKQFSRWLRQTQRVRHDPFAMLRPANEKADRRLVRRALTDDELCRLFDAAAKRPLATAEARRTIKGVSDAELVRLTAQGRVRAIVYALAAGTGLRRGELRRLRWCDVDLERATVRVVASSAKSRREQSVPLRADLAEALKAFRPADAGTTDTVVPPRCFPNAKTVRADMDAAGIEHEDAEGRKADFHALRHTFVSRLAAAGIHPREAQALARHSSVELTMQAYTDLRLLDLHGAVESTPDLLGPLLCPKPVQTSRRAAPRCATDGSRAGRAGGRQSRSGSGRTPETALVGSGGGKGTRTPDPRLAKPVL